MISVTVQARTLDELRIKLEKILASHDTGENERMGIHGSQLLVDKPNLPKVDPTAADIAKVIATPPPKRGYKRREMSVHGFPAVNERIARQLVDKQRIFTYKHLAVMSPEQKKRFIKWVKSLDVNVEKRQLNGRYKEQTVFTPWTSVFGKQILASKVAAI